MKKWYVVYVFDHYGGDEWKYASTEIEADIFNPLAVVDQLTEENRLNRKVILINQIEVPES